VSGQAWRDAFADSVALVERLRGEDREGCSVILRNADHGLTTIVLAKLLAESLDDFEVAPGWFRTWASSSSMDRP